MRGSHSRNRRLRTLRISGNVRVGFFPLTVNYFSIESAGKSVPEMDLIICTGAEEQRWYSR